MIIVTGAAGLIGSNLIKALNQRGETDILAVDNLTNANKIPNLAGLEINDFIDKRDFIDLIRDDAIQAEIDAVFHQGACSDTMEVDGRYIMENNYRYSVDLLDWCDEASIPFIYASSASVYGSGRTFVEAREHERPLNAYAYSKFLFDQVVRRRMTDDDDGAQSQVVGLRYFNVYGQGEAHKARMASMAYHFYNQFTAEGKVRLFVGSGDYGDGGHTRDFISVDDVVKVNLYFLDHPDKTGIFNCGTGRAQPFNDVAVAVVNAVSEARGLPPRDLATLLADQVVEYIPFPAALEGKYQPYTQASTTKLRAAGFADAFATVEEGVTKYVKQRMAG